MIVLDTNIVLDAFLFHDPAAQPLKEALAARQFQWIATQPMRDELARVLTYPKIVARLVFYQRTAEDVLARFDEQAQVVEVAPKATLICADPDDQKFIDLAVAHKARLLSKDNAVLCMAKRLRAVDVQVDQAINFVA